jgi:hypothetical protein
MELKTAPIFSLHSLRLAPLVTCHFKPMVKPSSYYPLDESSGTNPFDHAGNGFNASTSNTSSSTGSGATWTPWSATSIFLSEFFLKVNETMAIRSTLALSACLGYVIPIGVPLDGLAWIDKSASSLAQPQANTLDLTDNLPTNSNPYSIILNRNIFGLSPPSPPSPPPPSEVSLAAIKFTGYFKMPGEPIQGIFVSIPKDPKGKTVYFILAEGQRVGDLELVKIIVDDKVARVINAGNAFSLSLQDSTPIAPTPDNGPVPGTWLSGPQPRRFPR